MLSINGYKKTSKGENLGLIDILLLSRQTYLEQYREAIRRGEIIAGQELITALDMYITEETA